MRFRPLRPATAPEAPAEPVPDPPATMRATVIDATGDPVGAAHRHPSTCPRPC